MIFSYLYRISGSVLLLALLSVAFPRTGFAQTVVKGTVVDDYGYPVQGAIVHIKGDKNAVFTNSTGEFQLNAGPSATLVFERQGFNVVEAKVVTGRSLDVRLPSSYIQTGTAPSVSTMPTGDTIFIPSYTTPALNVLYGRAKQSSFLGAASTIGSSQLSTTPAPNYMYALPGRLAGLNVMQYSGFYSPATASLTSLDIFVGNIPNNTTGQGPTDNSEFNIQLRGHGGSAAQSPIAIVDGVQREYYSLDPEQIESVTVLKDALSNILLGQNSSRGSLIITTKQAVAGGPRVSFTAETGVQKAMSLPTPLSSYQYAYMLNEALLNDGKAPAYSAADFAAYRDHTDPIGHPDVNWYKTILQDHSRLNRYNLNVTGGGNTARYMVSLNYMTQNGLFVTSDANTYNTNAQLKRYVVNSKIDIDVNKDFNVGLQIMGRLQDGNQPGSTTAYLLSSLFTTPNNAYPVYNPNKSYGGSSNFTANMLGQTIGSGYKQDHLHDVMANLDLHYNLGKWVKGWWARANGNISVTEATLLDRAKQAPVFLRSVSNTGDTSYNRFGLTSNQINNFVNTSWARYRYFSLSTGYDRTFGEHSVSGMLFFDQKNSLLNYDIPAKLTNYAGKASYNYAEKYFIEGAATYSGYNRYIKDHQYGWFYAGGLGWNVAKENFMKGASSWLDQLKLRVTYGRTGNANIDAYGYYTWRQYFVGVAGFYPIGSNYPNGVGMAEQGTPGSASTVLANVNGTWEKADKLDAGIDFSAFHHHLQITADYYHEKYSDVMQVRGRNIALIGMNYPAENIGVNLFTGGELSVTYQNNIGDINFFVTGNASIQQSKVIYMDEQYQKYSWNVHTGHPVGQRFGVIADGLFQNGTDAAAAATISGYTPHAGDVKYKDLNGDGIIDQFDVAPIGKERPLIYYGLTAGVSWKGIEVSALFQGVANREIYLGNTTLDAGFQSQGNVYGQAYIQALQRWIPERSTTALYPRLTAGINGYNYSPLFQSNSLFLRDGNYIRIKNVDVAYNLPYSWLKKIKLRGVRIFANAQNLFTHAAYKGIDPEVNMPSYPMQKVINTGVTVKL